MRHLAAYTGRAGRGTTPAFAAGSSGGGVFAAGNGGRARQAGWCNLSAVALFKRLRKTLADGNPSPERSPTPLAAENGAY
jgi:hypothetical protein